MRSPVVWLCFGIVVLCALNVESRRSYHVVHGQTGPIFRSVVPTIGYTNVGPQFVGKRQQRQEEEEYDELIDEEDEDEEEDEEYQPGYGSAFGGSYESPPIDYEDEDEEDEESEEGEEGEEGEEDTDDEEFGERHDEVDNEVEGRQAYVNNQYIDEPYVHRQHRPQYNRVPVRTSNRKPTKAKPSKHSSNKKKPSHGNKKKPSSSLADVKPQSALTNKNKEPQSAIAMPATVVATSPLSTVKPSNPKPKLQLRPVATSTQFIATPVADLILRLSISLAKPIGQGNNTSFNVPIRIHQGVVKNVEESKVVRADVELPRTDKIAAVTVSSVDKHALKEDADVDEADEKDETADVPVTELSRK